MEKQVNRKLEYGNIPFGPYVMFTKIPEDIRIRLLKDGRKDLASYHKKLAGHLHTQLKYNPDTTQWFYKETNFKRCNSWLLLLE